ncbi:MAG: RsiV family protein [Dysgonamonadaceae bacterium]|jgi:hypothetical protein|nr:RsiV family protein [Dysgonamonadaceae bacterium]
MKTANAYFLILATCFFAAAGCKRIVKPTDNAVRFDSIDVNESYYLFNDTAQPGCNIQIHYVYPDSSGEQTLQNWFIDKMFGETFRDLTPEEVLKEYAQHYIDDFKRFETPKGRKLYAEDNDNQYADSSGYAYYTQLKNSILYNQNGFISFIVESVDYAGGMYNSKCVYAYVVNLATGDFLKEEDFSGINYRKNLSATLIDKIVAANGLNNAGELENLGYALSDIAPNDNFTIDNEGITYYFNENEIAGVREGVIRVFIPYEEIKLYVADNSPIASFFE